MPRIKSLFLALALVGCEIPTSLTDHLTTLAGSYNVASITCDLSVLSIASQETTTCAAFNPARTRIEPAGLLTWVSSSPAAVSVNTMGVLRAETVVFDSITITATGTDGSRASVLVASVP